MIGRSGGRAWRGGGRGFPCLLLTLHALEGSGWIRLSCSDSPEPAPLSGEGGRPQRASLALGWCTLHAPLPSPVWVAAAGPSNQHIHGLRALQRGCGHMQEG